MLAIPIMEAIDDPEDHALRNAGRAGPRPKNPNVILEATDDESDLGYQQTLRHRKEKHTCTKTSGAASHTSCQASVDSEAVDDPEDCACHNAGLSKTPNSVLEVTDDELEEDSTEEPGLQEETNEQELGM